MQTETNKNLTQKKKKKKVKEDLSNEISTADFEKF